MFYFMYVSYVIYDSFVSFSSSWTTITDAAGFVEERRSFDAWGNFRDASTWSGNMGRTPKFDRGFTGHEHLLDFGLINMNGRMYDPLLSSFLSPDNYMQDPTTQQGFNRYAYCMYNPLKYI
ncbi:MAG: RHS repeat-associated core domain-containing protein, partial [Bacteroidales bacterium]|nr:RHS repeat-associated core domain-containing protein [Bacteroidales bacterium]